MTTSPPTQRPVLRLGTRASLLARMQSQLVADLLAPHFAGEIIFEFITTTGDKLQPTPAAEKVMADSRSAAPAGAGGVKGLFVKEIEDALLAGRIDLAVHSAKDMPGEIPPGLVIAGTPPRELPNDVFIGRGGMTLAALPNEAVVGTSSLRRQAQLLMLRPDLKIIPLRGNIDTRLRKVAASSGEANAIQGTLLAAAGLRRAHLMPAHAEMLSTDAFIPAAGQGTLALECRSEDTLMGDLVRKIHNPITFAALEFERQIVRSFACDCLSPIAVCTEPRGLVDGSQQRGWIVRALIARPDGTEFARAALLTEDSTPAGLQALAPLLVKTLESRGARGILASLAAGGHLPAGGP